MLFQARHHGEAFQGRAPSQITAYAPQTKIVLPPKQGLCPEEINRLVWYWSAIWGLRLPKYWMLPQNSWARTVFSVDFAINTVCFGGFTSEFIGIHTYVCGRRLFLSSPQNSWKFAHFLARRPFLVFISELNFLSPSPKFIYASPVTQSWRRAYAVCLHFLRVDCNQSWPMVELRSRNWVVIWLLAAFSCNPTS